MSPFCARYSVPGSTILGRVADGLKTLDSAGMLCFLDAINRLMPRPNPAMSASNRTTVSARLTVVAYTAGKYLCVRGRMRFQLGLSESWFPTIRGVLYGEARITCCTFCNCTLLAIGSSEAI